MRSDDILRSWKEISAYLECDRRTCLRWEKSLGLPVHRMEGSEKGGVFAYREELDKWLVQRSGQAAEPVREAPEVVEAGRKWVRLEFRRWSRKRLMTMHLALWTVIAAAFFLADPPADAARSGRLPDRRLRSWSFWARAAVSSFGMRTGVEDLLETGGLPAIPQERYVRLGMSGKRLPYIGFHDIDLDGRRETLFCIQTADETNEGDDPLPGYPGRQALELQSRPGIDVRRPGLFVGLSDLRVRPL